jgi:hypothetical protein
LWANADSLEGDNSGVWKVVESAGEPIGFIRALFRNLFAIFVSALPLYLGFLWVTPRALFKVAAENPQAVAEALSA